ncbi:MAG: hypothetical protein K9J51_04035 [Desulfotignum sp.]|nr:hypothetical protein [Desulfotignum sp.]
MTDQIQCPVCQYAHIPRDMETCPQCDSDLTCFQLLDRLSDKPQEQALFPPEAATKEKSAFYDTSDDRETSSLNSNDLSGSHPRLVPLALMALTLVLAGFFIFFTYRFSSVEHQLLRQQRALTQDVKTFMHENRTRMARIESRLSQLLSHREIDPILNSKKQPQIAIKPILIISEARKTDAGSKVIEIDME